MLPPVQQQLISLGLLGLGLYFAVQLARGLAGYLRYRRVAPTAVVTWPAPPAGPVALARAARRPRRRHRGRQRVAAPADPPRGRPRADGRLLPRPGAARPAHPPRPLPRRRVGAPGLPALGRRRPDRVRGDAADRAAAAAPARRGVLQAAGAGRGVRRRAEGPRGEGPRRRRSISTRPSWGSDASGSGAALPRRSMRPRPDGPVPLLRQTLGFHCLDAPPSALPPLRSSSSRVSRASAGQAVVLRRRRPGVDGAQVRPAT